MKLRYTPRARADIAEIHTYIAKHNRRAATAVVREIRATARLLRRYPGLARPTDIQDVKSLPVSRYPYLVYCRIATRQVVIVHVRHGSRASPTRGDL